MSPILKHKKMIVALAIVALIGAAGFTYAWFTSSYTVETKASLGNLGVNVAYDVDNEEIYYEPGLSAHVDGTVHNIGTISLIVRIDTDSTVTIKREDDGTPLDPQDYYQVANVAGIDVTMDESILGYRMGANDEFLIWFMVDDVYYIAIDGNIGADLVFDLDFDGSLGNSFQDADVTLNGTFLATQAMNGATQANFGFSYDDLEVDSFFWNDLDGAALPFSARAASNEASEVIMARLEALFNR